MPATSPEVVKAYGLGVLPGVFNQTTRTREVQELTGNRWVPTLVLDDGTVIDDSRGDRRVGRRHPATPRSSGRRSGAAGERQHERRPEGEQSTAATADSPAERGLSAPAHAPSPCVPSARRTARPPPRSPGSGSRRPSRIGILISCWARAVSSVAEAVALGAEGEHRTGRQVPRRRAGAVRDRARAAAARLARAPPALSSRATGSAKCRPAAPRSASGCHGSWVPVVSTPAASAAAATRTQAPMLPRSRGSSSRITGAGWGLARIAAGGRRGRSAIAITGVLGASGASCSNSSPFDHLGLRQPAGRGPGRAPRPAARSSLGSLVTSSSRLAPNRARA